MTTSQPGPTRVDLQAKYPAMFEMHAGAVGALKMPWEHNSFLADVPGGPFKEDMKRMVELIKAGPVRIFRNNAGDVEVMASTEWKAKHPKEYAWSVMLFFDISRKETRRYIAPKLEEYRT